MVSAILVEMVLASDKTALGTNRAAAKLVLVVGGNMVAACYA